jgi:2-hydroxy-6-oxonona-2,4-dienedioate hydrolase
MALSGDQKISEILRAVHQSAERMGSCDPLWLKNNTAPIFRSTGSNSSGPEILLLHGLLGALSNWDSLFPLLAKYSKPVALEFPILSAHRSEVRVKPLVAYTEYFIRQQQIQPVSVCGNSLGGHVALRLCLASPELVDCLILSGTSGLYEHSVDSLPVRPDAKFIREHMKRVFYHDRYITDAAVNEIRDLLQSRTNTLNLIHAARSAKKDNLLNELKDISVPTLLLWGEDDQVTTMGVAETFHKNIPGSKLVTIKNCGHAPMIEHPEWFADQVQKFLREHSRAFRRTI